MHSESSWEARLCLSPLPPAHLQHPSQPLSPLHCRWSHPPDTQQLQSAAIREETAESPGEDQQTEGQLHTSAQLSPPPFFCPRTLWTPPTHTHTHTHTHTLTSNSHFVQHQATFGVRQATQIDMITFIFNGESWWLTATVGDGMWACQAMRVKQQNLSFMQMSSEFREPQPIGVKNLSAAIPRHRLERTQDRTDFRSSGSHWMTVLNDWTATT